MKAMPKKNKQFADAKHVKGVDAMSMQGVQPTEVNPRKGAQEVERKSTGEEYAG